MLTAEIFVDVSRKTIQTWTDGRNTKYVGLGATKCYASDPRQNTKHVGLRANEKTNATPVTQDITQNMWVYEQTNATPVTQDRTQTGVYEHCCIGNFLSLEIYKKEEKLIKLLNILAFTFYERHFTSY